MPHPGLPSSAPRTAIFLLLTLLALCLAPHARADLPEQPRFQSLNQQISEPFDSSWAIVQDRDGNMWFGGQNGLRRYDGHRMTLFRGGDSSHLAHNWIRTLAVDPTGRLWVGTQRGLQRFDPATDTFVDVFLPPAVLGSSVPRVRAIAADGRGIWWIDNNVGLYFRDARSGAIQRLLVVDKPASLRDLVLDRFGRLWMGDHGRVAMVEPGTGQTRWFPLPGADRAGAPQANVFSVATSGDDLWVGTGAGLLHWSLGGGAMQAPTLQTFDGGLVWRLLPGHDGSLWIGTDIGLFHRDRNGHVDSYRHNEADPHSIGDPRIDVLYLDRKETLWIGPIASGLYTLDTTHGFRRHFRAGGGPGQLSSNKITSMRPAGGGRIWVGTIDAGLDLVDPGGATVSNFHHDPRVPASLRSDRELFLTMPDAGGRFWISTADGIDRFEPRDASFHRVTPAATSGSHVLVHGLERDHQGMLWLATHGGLRKIDPVSGAWEPIPNMPRADGHFAPQLIWSMAMDAKGLLWLGSAGGLGRFDTLTERCTMIDLPELHGVVGAVMPAADGSLWAGVDSAVVHLVPENGRMRATLRVQLEDTIDTFLEASDGAVWAATQGGLARIDPVQATVRRFHQSDGLIDGSYAAALRGEDGTLYFGGFSAGLASLRPGRIAAAAPPTPVLTDVHLSEASLLHGAVPSGVKLERSGGVPALILPHEHSGLRLDFSALQFGDPARTRYAVQLAGLDKQATRGAAASAGYGRLPPGEYRLHVRAAGPDGVWGPDTTLLAIRVAPPWWMTWWFSATVALALLLIAYVVYVLRVRFLLRRQRGLELLADERTAQLRAALDELQAAQQTDRAA